MQMRQKNIHALLRTPQRGSITRTSAITNGAPQLARRSGADHRRTSISDGSSRHACAIIATSKSRMAAEIGGAPIQFQWARTRGSG